MTQGITRLAVAGIAVLLAIAPGSVEGQARVDVSEPQALLRRGDAAGAAALLEAITAREPGDARAWRMLGYASIKTKAYDRALEAYRRSLAIEPDDPSACYNLGVVYAKLGQPDDAFVWLGKARASRKLDMSVVDVDDDLAGLRSDARFASLRPTPADYEHPFVEAVDILREWDAEAAGDEFGWIARGVGDVDGDGATEVVTSAPSHASGAGRIYVYSSRSGRRLWTADGRAGERLGNGVEGAGDTNRDGVPDVVAGAPNAGAAYVYSGRDGRVLRTLHGSNPPHDAFGQHVSGAGDVDGDGFADVVIGAPGDGSTKDDPGHAYVVSGKTGVALVTLVGERAGDGFGSTVAGAFVKGRGLLVVGAPKAGSRSTGRVYVYDRPSKVPKFVGESDSTGAALGAMFVSVSGDVDGDGTPDVYASDWSNAAHGPATGRIFVYSGATGRTLLTLTGDAAGEGFGTCPATAGDVDGDGRADLVVGSWQYAGAAISGGRAQLFSGRDGSVLRTFTCRTPGDTFGFDAVGIGDVDGDGTVDLLVTSAWSGVRGYHGGRVFILSSGVRAGARQPEMRRATAVYRPR